MDVVRVQRWVMSTLLLTVAFIFAGGIALSSATTSGQQGARPGLLIISVVVGLGAIEGVRAINARPFVTPWLILGALPAFLGWFLSR